ncbi:MAG TPA: two-component sensor histidine kinase, partial [Alphaproteobacteria bacterium]|nr:two-component sensor histidine kinase [Alphaproteobacteria bacterium]
MLKRLMPRSLFGRALLILATPMVLLQVIAAVVFFDRHLDSVTLRLSRSVTNDINYILNELSETPDRDAR